jgi:hypothetical protein
MTADPIDVPDDVGIPSVDVCSFCSDSECDGIGCIAGLDPDDLDDQGLIEQLHDLIRAGAAWKIMQTHGYTVAERVLAHAEHRAATPPTSHPMTDAPMSTLTACVLCGDDAEVVGAPGPNEPVDEYTCCGCGCSFLSDGTLTREPVENPDA